jgi:hypothetical protein
VAADKPPRFFIPGDSMARQELHSDQLPKTEQMPPVSDPSTYDGDVVLTERTHEQDYLDELAFMEEPCTIRIEPSSDRNAAGAMPVWVNGKMAEVYQNGRWDEIGYLPVGRVLIVKRKVLEVIIRAKIDTVQTKILEQDSERPNNVVNRFTSPVHSFSILEDRNPRGPAWVSELRRRNL